MTVEPPVERSDTVIETGAAGCAANADCGGAMAVMVVEVHEVT